MASKGPASIRANNPGNIKTGVPWEGICGTTGVSEGVNDVFETPVYGARALAKNIQAKADGRASNSEDLFNILSPESENNTKGYVIPTVVDFMNKNGYPKFDQYTPIFDAANGYNFRTDGKFGTTFMQAITNMEQAGALDAFPRDLLQYGWESKDKQKGDYDPYKFGNNSDKGFLGCDQKSAPADTKDPVENSNSPLGSKGPGSSYSGSGSGGASGGGGDYGFKDPEGEFVREEYEYKPTTNEAARDQRETKVKLPDVPEPVTQEAKDKLKELLQTPSEYPYNKVYETPGGHRSEYDDTAKAPKTTWTHSEGAGIEMHKEGDVLEVAPGQMLKVAGAGFVLSVTGNGELVFDGDLDITVTGDFNVNCANFTVNTSGSMIEEIGDRKSTTAQNNISMNAVKGNISEIAKENHVTSSKNKYALAGETITSVSKDHKIYTNNDIDIKANNNTKIASKQNTDILGKKMNVVGPEGTFGGENVVMYANTAHTDVQGNVKGDVEGNVKGDVEGDLKGTALVSQFAQRFIIGAPAISRAEAQTANNQQTAQPTSSNINDALEKTDAGVGDAKTDTETIDATSQAPIPSDGPAEPDSPEKTYDEGSSEELPTLEGKNIIVPKSELDKLPKQHIIDAVDKAAKENGVYVLMIEDGGAAFRSSGTPNHPPGYAMDFILVDSSGNAIPYGNPEWEGMKKSLAGDSNRAKVYSETGSGLGFGEYGGKYYRRANQPVGAGGFFHYDQTPKSLNPARSGPNAYWKKYNNNTNYNFEFETFNEYIYGKK